MTDAMNRESPEDGAFRDEVRTFLAEKFTPELRAWAALQTGVFAEPPLARRWHQILYEQGWIAPSWPREYGGTGWSLSQRYIFHQECAEAGTPILPAMGLQMCGPVLMRFGTDAQKQFFLPRILSGEHYWCQGYSEPQAGSDLASLQCRAERDGEHYIVNGAKIWTTHAHVANWIFLLVRTQKTEKRQQGISFLLVEMNTPGIQVRPIISISGEHEVNEVFFDQVRVPAENLVGEENDGWTVAKYLLEYERGGGSPSARVKAILGRVRQIAARVPAGPGTLLRDDDFANRLARLEISQQALQATEARLLAAATGGEGIGHATASLMKLRGSHLIQEATELALEAVGPYGWADQHEALTLDTADQALGPAAAAWPTGLYLNARASTIFGGSAEIQHEIIAKILVD